MKIKIFVFVILIFCLLFTGCGAKMSTVNDGHDRSMFVLIEDGSAYKIVYHRETKVMYAVSWGTYNCGNFTVMIDEEGKPLLYNKEGTDE